MRAAPKTLRAFTTEERTRAHRLLAATVARMSGRKLEEGDWSKVYCGAKKIPEAGWSNLEIDINFNGLGVEHKMVCAKSNKAIADCCGTRVMHPAATRSIRIPVEPDPTKAARDVLKQYAERIRAQAKKVAEAGKVKKPDMRTGWLIWQETLREFLYFEEEMLEPDPNDYVAEWHESGGGARKKSRNLWVFEKGSGVKRYSITTEAGAKIQPYFDVPPPADPNVYIFTVQGEPLDTGLVRMWLTAETAEAFFAAIGSKDTKRISEAVLKHTRPLKDAGLVAATVSEDVVEVLVTQDAYQAICRVCDGVSDEHCVQLLTAYLRQLK